MVSINREERDCDTYFKMQKILRNVIDDPETPGFTIEKR
jgi:hypothetical protein